MVTIQAAIHSSVKPSSHNTLEHISAEDAVAKNNRVRMEKILFCHAATLLFTLPAWKMVQMLQNYRLLDWVAFLFR